MNKDVVLFLSIIAVVMISGLWVWAYYNDRL